VKACGYEPNRTARGDTCRRKYWETSEPGGTGQGLERDKVEGTDAYMAYISVVMR
jgi:hypothetical protein